MKISDKAKVLALFFASFFVVLQSDAQCTSFELNVLQDDVCNGNGILEVVVDPSFVPPYTIEVTYPNGTLTNNNFVSDTLILNSLNGGTYTVEVYSGLDTCSASATIADLGFTVNFFSGNAFSNNGYDVSCYGSCDASLAINLFNTSGTYTIEWYQDSISGTPIYTSTGNSSNQNNLCAGNYVFSINSPTGCQTPVYRTLRQPDSLYADITNITNVVCNGEDQGAIEIDVVGGVGDVINNNTGNVIGSENYSISWSGPNSFSSTSEDISGLFGGDYSLVIEDDNNCIYANTYTVLDSILPVQLNQTFNDISCFGANDGLISVNGVGGTSPYQYQWSGNSSSTANTISNLSQGNYEVVLTDFYNCSDTLNFTLTEPTPLSLTPVITDINCFGDFTGELSLSVSGGTAPFSFNHDPNVGSAASITTNNYIIQNLPSGDVEVTVTDTNSCILTDTFTIQENPEITAMFTNITPETCSNNNGSATIIVNGGVPNYFVEWVQAQQFGFSATQLSGSGSQNLLVEVTDQLNCVKVFDVFIPEIPDIHIDDISVTNNLCFGGNAGQIEVETAGGLFPFSFTLTGIAAPFISNSSISILDSLSAGTYNLSVEDSLGCTDVWNSNITITENSQIIAEVDTALSTHTLLCNGDDNGKIFIDVSGGNPFSGNYYWLFVNDPNFSQQIVVDSITGVSAGMYNLSFQDANGCTAQTSYEVFEPEMLSVSHIITNVSCNGLSNGEALIVVSGGTPSFTISSLTSSSANLTQLSTDTFKVTGLSEGMYFYNLTDANGCNLLNNSFYIGEPSEIEILDVSSTLESCVEWDASASVNIAGGSGSYTILWSYDNAYQLPLLLQNGSLNPTAQTANPQNLTEGMIYVHVWDIYSCYTLDSIYISKATSPSLALVGTVDNLCYGDQMGQISLNATGGNPFYEFTINGGLSWQHLSTFGDLPEGIYNASVRDSLGCVDELENIHIDAPTPISVTVSTQMVSCSGSSDGSASVTSVAGGTTSSGTYSFSWQNNQGINLWPANLSAVNPTVQGLLPGTYQLLVQDDNGCSSTYTPVTIAEPSPVTVDLSVLSDYNGLDISCFGYTDAIILANAGGGTGLYTFEWYNTTSSQDVRTNTTASFDTLSLVPKDDYTVVVTDANGCTTNDVISVNHPDKIEVDFEDIIHIRCQGSHDGQATATYSGGLGFGNYAVSWTNSSNSVIALTAQATNLSSGTYYATYTDNNGCSGTDSVSINYSELFSINNLEDTTSVSCLGSIDGTFNFNVSGGWLPYSYTWNDPLNQQSATAVGLAPGMWYTNIITDANNCILVDSVYVTTPIDLVEIVTYSITDNDCYENTNGAITVVVDGGTPNYDFQWTGPGTTNLTTQNISGLIKGTYNLVVTDSFGCQHTSTYEVEGPDSPLLINSVVTTDVSCNGLSDGTATLNNQIVGGTTPYVNIDWNGENPNILSAGSYSVEVTDNNGCKKSATYIINEPDAYSVSYDILNEVCQGQNGQIVVHVSGATPFNTGFYNYDLTATSLISPFFNYQSSPNTQANIVVTFPNDNDIADTTFLLTITDQNGCIFTTDIEIHPARLFNYNEVLNICYGDSLSIDGSKYANYDSYSWIVSPIQEFQQIGSEMEMLVQNSSTVSLTVTDNSSNCTFSDEFDIVVLNPVISANEHTGIVVGQSITLSIIDGEAPYLWSTDEVTSSIEVSPLVTTNYIAYALDTATGCIGNDTVRVFVGMNDGFSPNNDGFNDTWEISYLNQYESTTIEIFNRWGASLWKNSSPSISNWDGKYNGKDLPVGTYYYIITFGDGINKEPLTGPVTIVR